MIFDAVVTMLLTSIIFVMEIKYTSFGNHVFAEILADGIIINDTQDALDLMAETGYNDARCMVITEKNLHPDFFKLYTGLAGEILQKFSNYNFRLAIIGDYSKTESKSLRDFIYESNKQGRIRFVSSRDEALKI